MTGRPSVYNQELATEICTRLACGESLRSICKSDHIPSFQTVLTWAFTPEHPFLEQYARAREMQADALADELQDIADDGSNDWMLREGKEVINNEHVQRSRLRVDTRKWIASKLKPKRYGDRIHTEHSGNVSLSSLITESIDKKEK